MVNLGLISDIRGNETVGAVAIDTESGELAFFSEDPVLETALDIILDDDLHHMVIERRGSVSLSRESKVTHTDGTYLSLLSYRLPFPWRIVSGYISHDEIYASLNALADKLYSQEGDSNEQIT